jgi:hypothetical protein
LAVVPRPTVKAKAKPAVIVIFVILVIYEISSKSFKHSPESGKRYTPILSNDRAR